MKKIMVVSPLGKRLLSPLKFPLIVQELTFVILLFPTATSRVMIVLNEWWPHVNENCIDALKQGMAHHSIDDTAMLTVGQLAKVSFVSFRRPRSCV